MGIKNLLKNLIRFGLAMLVAGAPAVVLATNDALTGQGADISLSSPSVTIHL